ncbi:DUF480 domain-containing protein [bacterium]|nr:DUF480 domain-containing protein [bacterium]
MSDPETGESELLPVRELSTAQQRVLGVLLEKAFTTPEYYPLTLKAVATGCNQKSNRSPVVDYDEDRVEDVLHELKELGLVGELHPDSGRALRYRHYMRKRFPFTEPQLAIITELLLRGRQTLGELRGRASRMVPINDLGTLRDELQSLLEQGYVQASGALEQRGVEVDHGFYRAGEAQPMATLPDDDSPSNHSPAPMYVASPAASRPASSATSSSELETLRRDVALLRQQNQELTSEISSLRNELADLERRIDDLCRDLGA